MVTRIAPSPTGFFHIGTLTIQDMINTFNGGNLNQSNTKVFKDKLDFLQKKITKTEIK